MALRRSSRYLPQVTATLEGGWQFSWQGIPLLSQKVALPREQTDVACNDIVDQDDRDTTTTVERVFYRAFSRNVTDLGRRKTERLATQVFGIGDTVLLPSNNKKLPYVGVIIALWEDKTLEGAPNREPKEPVKYVQVHWFIRPQNCPKFGRPRTHGKNEIYYTLDQTGIHELQAIIAHCKVSRPKEKAKQPPTKKDRQDSTEPESSSEDQNIQTFVCSRATEPRTGTYYDLDWEKLRQKAVKKSQPRDLKLWNVIVAKPRRQMKISNAKSSKEEEMEEGTDSGDNDSDAYEDTDESEESSSESTFGAANGLLSGEDDAVHEESTKGMKRKRPKTSDPHTPQKQKRRRGIGGKPTPHSKAALNHRKRKKTGIDVLAVYAQQSSIEIARLQALPPDPYLRAMHVLHVGARPETLPCRENEYAEVMTAILTHLEESMGGCIYISGVPGTGKTATVHAVVRDLKAMAQRSETNPFTYVEINGLKIPEPSAAYGRLWEALSDHDMENEGHLKISSKEALKNLNQYFTARSGPGGHACVVLMDELDQMVTPKQDVIYNFFNWPNLGKSRLIVIAIANTHDLPERVLTGKVRSRLGMVRINFHPYKAEQLCKIVQARLDSAHEGLPVGTRREIVEPDAIRFAATKISGLSGDARRVLDICRRAVELTRSNNADAVTIPHVKRVIDAMQNSPTAGYLENCSLHEKIMLASLLKCVRREGVEEIRWGDVAHQHHVYMNILPGPGDSKRKPTYAELALVLDSLVASRAILLEEGLTATRKPLNDRKVILNIEAREVERVLSETGSNWQNALGISEST